MVLEASLYILGEIQGRAAFALTINKSCSVAYSGALRRACLLQMAGKDVKVEVVGCSGGGGGGGISG